MNGRHQSGTPFGGGIGGMGGIGNPFAGPVPRDLLALLAVVFVTFSLQFFALTAIVPALLRLTPAVWRTGFLWQLASYPFAGFGGPSIWFLLELLILFWFGRDVFYRLGRRRFWQLLVGGAAVAGLAAVIVQLLLLAAGGTESTAFVIMQGQRTLLALVIAAFATLNRNATILLFFVLPIRARWFLAIEVLFAFMAFLGSGDFAGFVGISTAVGATYLWLSGGATRGALRRGWLRYQERRIRRELDRERRKRGLRVVRGEGRGGDPPADSDPWLH